MAIVVLNSAYMTYLDHCLPHCLALPGPAWTIAWTSALHLPSLSLAPFLHKRAVDAQKYLLLLRP